MLTKLTYHSRVADLLKRYIGENFLKYFIGQDPQPTLLLMGSHFLCLDRGSRSSYGASYHHRGRGEQIPAAVSACFETFPTWV